MFFDSWSDLFRVVVVGSLAYVALVAFLRVTGKRTLSKLNAFDLVVTVALGSTLATVLLNADVSLSEGVLAFALLIGLQYGITWLSVRSERFQGMIKAEPTLLLYRGRYLRDAMRRQRVTTEEILSVLRTEGVTRVEDAGAVVLETDGSISVLSDLGAETATVLATTNVPER
ncbi:uncharacterized membrane protein YcaP (DUF421 family) [Constrictibacter sp. MBR-5]|jgi:uncharacterized membrane protein YcaP (DUF421 family)|uniref:DUF421 domain-containing protein n=1 Tax=Constrictibacter sp. MBR-5 TaxID=3156467 RepID=UPI0033931F8D